MVERRKRQRFELRLACEIVHVASGLKTKGETRNISSSGVVLTCEKRLKVGQHIEYTISLPRFRRARKDVSVRCKGMVLRELPEKTFAVSLEHYEFVRLRAPKRGKAAT
ncbi:MAG: PilZ protein [Bryobacterales bacterium]|nr:PilZ protein [Bryobacterales bacterium]